MRDRLGYFVGTWGNISVRVTDGLLVTPSRVRYEEVQPDDLVVVGWEGGVVRGHRVPTSETELHRQIMLARADLGAIIHSHSPWASVCACAHRSIPVLSDDMAEVIGGEVHCAKYAPAGRHRELAAAAREAIGPNAGAVLLGNHGVVAGGRDLAEAIIAAQFVEKAAMVMIQAAAIGGVKPIPEELWREERHRYLYKYGKPEDVADILKPREGPPHA
jgi:L-fuculose-phosphate aldolase